MCPVGQHACTHDASLHASAARGAGVIAGGAALSTPGCRRDFSEQLWRRARQAGAVEREERREFGIADDMYQAGLLSAYLVLVPLCPPGSVDGAAVQRLFEVTFRLDFEAIRCGLPP